MEALCMPGCRIEIFDLTHNKLSNASCIQLACIIRNSPFLKKLGLSHNHLSGPHFFILVDALASPDCRIEEINLKENGLTDEEKGALQKLETLKPSMRILY